MNLPGSCGEWGRGEAGLHLTSAVFVVEPQVNKGSPNSLACLVISNIMYEKRLCFKTFKSLSVHSGPLLIFGFAVQGFSYPESIMVQKY